jgi:hypothetical protein
MTMRMKMPISPPTMPPIAFCDSSTRRVRVKRRMKRVERAVSDGAKGGGGVGVRDEG